jgi:hypothetical protein
MAVGALSHLLLLLASLWTTTHGLMFASTNVTKQWDTWVFVENSTWYAYYLVTRHELAESPLVTAFTSWLRACLA